MLKSIASLSLMLSLILLTASPARATHHLWDVNEVFSNADGTIQFVELWEPTGDNAENLVGGFTVTTNGSSFTFGANLPAGDTGLKFILLATAGFAALPGAVTPDYIIPDNFFDVNGDTIRYAGATDVFTFGSGALPINGTLSLNRDLSTGLNTPTNFAGQVGSINLFEEEIPSVSKFGILALAILIVGAGVVVRRRMRSGDTTSHA